MANDGCPGTLTTSCIRQLAELAWSGACVIVTICADPRTGSLIRFNPSNQPMLPPRLWCSGLCRSARSFREDSAGSRDNRRMRVLVVDDEVRLARSLRVGLEAEGFAVDVAHDGTDGLWLARENTYDVIVLDLMLPGINGYKVCETLRDEQDWTPILMLTAKDGE